jgi:hypothetical protein
MELFRAEPRLSGVLLLGNGKNRVNGYQTAWKDWDSPYFAHAMPGGTPKFLVSLYPDLWLDRDAHNVLSLGLK